MSIINAYGNPTVTIWEIDDNGEKISVPIQNETKQVIGNKIVLEGLPDEQYRVFIDGFVEIGIKEKITEPNQFKVDYRRDGIVFVHESLNGQWLTVGRYYSRGMYYIPAGRIWTKLGIAGEVIETLEDALVVVENISGDIGHIIEVVEGAINTKNELIQAIDDANSVSSALIHNISEASDVINEISDSISTGDTFVGDINTAIGNANTAKASLNETIANANNAKSELNNIIGSANLLHDNLESLINTGTTLNNSLSNNIQSGNTLLSQLENMITNANTTKSNLDGSITNANTTKAGLDNSISEGITLKSELDDIIAGTDFEQVITDVNDLKTSKANKDYVDTELGKKVDEVTLLDKIRGTLLTGLSLTSNAVISATDTILSSLGKLQKQITDFKSLKGVANGLAELDSSGHVPSHQLPSYVDDVLEYPSRPNFPTTGESGKIYVSIDTNLTWRWTGTTYVEISPSIALGETSSTAYRGDRGKTAYDHSQSAHAPSNAQKNSDITKAEIEAKLTGTITTHGHTVTKSDVGLSNVTNDKQMPISNGVLENYREKLVTLSGTATAINLSLGNVFAHTLSGNTTYSITNAQAQSHSFTLIINQGATARTVTFPASVKWAGKEIPDLSEPNTEYTITFMTKNGGTNWTGFFGGGA